MKSLPDLMRKLAPALLANGQKRGNAPGWGEITLLLEHWDEIVGADYARQTSPAWLKFQGAERRAGTLGLTAPGALRLELQHDSALILERVNRIFGFGAVARLQLLPNSSIAEAQGGSLPEPVLRPVDPALLDGVEDEGLRAALASLGAHLPKR